MAEETDVSHTTKEPPRRREKRPASADILAGTPRAKEQKGANNIIVKECGRVLPPGTLTANRLRERRQDAEYDGEIAAN